MAVKAGGACDAMRPLVATVLAMGAIVLVTGTLGRALHLAGTSLTLLENTGNFAPERGDAERDGGGRRSVRVWLPFALLISTLPAFYVALHYTMRHRNWRQGVTPLERRT